MIAQTQTSAVELVVQFVGWDNIRILAGIFFASGFAYFRGNRLVAPLVATIEWFRSYGADDLDLGGMGLTVAQQEAVRKKVQSWLWASLRDAALRLSSRVGLLKAMDDKVQSVTGGLKVTKNADGKDAPPATIEGTVARLKKTTGVMSVFRTDDTEKGKPI